MARIIDIPTDELMSTMYRRNNSIWFASVAVFTLVFLTSFEPPPMAQLYQVNHAAQGAAEMDDPFAEETAAEVNDPWESFNSKMFTFNHNVDRYVLKPVARGYDRVMPDPAEEAVSNFFHNVGFIPRMVNSLVQGKPKRSGTELGRFVINSTAGVAGFFDVATKIGLPSPPAEDTGQSLAVYGSDPGPYLVLPLLPPLTVRDGAGTLADLAMDPVNYFLPFAAIFGAKAENRVNDQSRGLELQETFEEGTVDLYGATKDAYFQKRAKAIAE